MEQPGQRRSPRAGARLGPARQVYQAIAFQYRSFVGHRVPGSGFRAVDF